MRVIHIACLFAAALIGNGSPAADKPFTGIFRGNGRACFGALSIRPKTIEWHSTYSTCGPTAYEILEQDLLAKNARIVFLLKNHSKHCSHQVIELQHYEQNVWDVKGYSSLEAYQKKELPDWKDSTLPEREALSCGLLKAD